ncbi:MAG: glycerol-3-phosphate acyltransferase [Anaerolineales bacterium]|nr:MAG: glycerol-3-phosphate acyltransferase [Anaerolineales bacterium]
MVVKGIGALILAYALGSIPFGLIIVRLTRGRDIRQWYSGRTGGTNVMRVAGTWAGLATAILDLSKSALAIVCARWLAGGNVWWEVGAGILTVVGHNTSLFLMRKQDGKWVSGGGAGGAAVFGSAIGIWPPTLLITLPLGALVYFGIGYASVTTMSLPIIIGIIFLIRASLGLAAWEYLVFALGAELLILWALRPNLQRLAKGEERLVGWRARRKLASEAEEARQVKSQADEV